MEKIIKWLQENNIEFIQGANPWHHDERWIVITMATSCLVNILFVTEKMLKRLANA